MNDQKDPSWRKVSFRLLSFKKFWPWHPQSQIPNANLGAKGQLILKCPFVVLKISTLYTANWRILF